MAQDTNQNDKNLNSISETVENPEETAQVETGQEYNNTTNDLQKEAMKALQLDAANKAGVMRVLVYLLKIWF